jgi:chromate transporter
MESETVRKRGWVTSEEFLDLLGATHLIPGPNSTEMAMHLGYRRAGMWGLWLGGAAFILPAALLVMGIAAVYSRWGQLPTFRAPLYGVQAVMIAVVLQAAWALGRTALKRHSLAVIALLALVLRGYGIHELILLLAAGGFALAIDRFPGRQAVAGIALPVVSLLEPLNWISQWISGLPQTVRLFLVFFKIGSILYGSGYVLLAFLQADLVDRLHWITSGQLLDSVVVGQATPGPVLTTATFLGYLVGGPMGAMAGTVGIFLPAFILVSLTCRWLPRLRQTPRWGPAIDGVNAASLGLLAMVAWQLGRAAIVDVGSGLIALVSLALLLRTKVNSMWLMIGGGLIGWFFQR